MNPLARYELENFLSLRIIDAAKRVYGSLGSGLQEQTYCHAIANELRQQKLEALVHFPVDVWQSGELAVLYFLDLFVEYQVIVEVRSARRLSLEAERDQMADYLEAANAPLGILLNFGRPRLEFERIFPS